MDTELSYSVIGAAMEVHRELGPGLEEPFYHDLLSDILHRKGIEHQSRPREQLIHRGIVADRFEADLVFTKTLITEVKCLLGAFHGEHYAQIMCYQKFWNIGVGLLTDFRKESLSFKRVVYSPVVIAGLSAVRLMKDFPGSSSDRVLAESICSCVVRIATEYGLGYRDSTYCGLVAADLAADGIKCTSTPPAQVPCGENLLGLANCDCLAVDHRCAVKCLALRQEIRAADCAILQTYLRLLDLPCGLIVNFGKREFNFNWVSAKVRSRG